MAITLFWYFISVFEKEKLALWLRLLPMKERQHKEFLLLAGLGIQRLFQKENTRKQTIAAAQKSLCRRMKKLR